MVIGLSKFPCFLKSWICTLIYGVGLSRMRESRRLRSGRLWDSVRPRVEGGLKLSVFWNSMADGDGAGCILCTRSAWGMMHHHFSAQNDGDVFMIVFDSPRFLFPR